MKTLSFLKRSAILQAFFCAVCAVSLLLAYSEHANWTIGKSMHLSVLGIFVFFVLCLFNPVGPVCLILGLVKSNRERQDDEARRLIGNKWIWFVVMFLITTFVYVLSMILLVQITGGV